MAAFYYGLLFLGRKCLHVTSQKRALSIAISLAVNYRLFSHGDVSYRFNGKNDNVVLELLLKNAPFICSTVMFNPLVPQGHWKAGSVDNDRKRLYDHWAHWAHWKKFCFYCYHVSGATSRETCLWGFRPGPTQTSLYSHRRWLKV